MARTVILPGEIDRKATNLAARLQEEMHGVLLYSPVQLLCPVDYMFATGVGTQSHVQALQPRLDILNEFFRTNPSYRYVEFHTHSAGTIRDCGEYFARNFSGGDHQTIEQKFADDASYIHVLFTPIKKLVASRDDSKVVVIDDLPGYEERSIAVGTAIDAIARRLGVDVGYLPATQIR